MTNAQRARLEALADQIEVVGREINREAEDAWRNEFFAGASRLNKEVKVLFAAAWDVKRIARADTPSQGV